MRAEIAAGIGAVGIGAVSFAHERNHEDQRPGPGSVLPMATAGDQVTDLLAAASGGNVDAMNRLFPFVYDELRGLAHGRMRGERADHTLNTTALVHEAYIRLIDQTRVQWQNRAHFFAIASRAMRRILLDHADARRAAKRGGGSIHVVLEEAAIVLDDERADELIALNEALERLKTFNARGADVVVYRFFGGLSYEEIAEVMGTSAITIRRAWSTARSWLHRELREAVGGNA